MPEPNKYRRNPWDVSLSPSVKYVPTNPSKSRVKEKGLTLEGEVNEWLGNPKGRAFNYADSLIEANPDGTMNDQPDNVRHSTAGLYTAQAISDRLKYGAGMIDSPLNRVISDIAGVVGANAMGLGHELKHLPKLIEEEWAKDGITGIYNALRTTSEDAANNFVGSLLSIMPGLTPGEAEEIIVELSNNNLLPDGLSGGKSNLYIKGDHPARQVSKDYNR